MLIVIALVIVMALIATVVILVVRATGDAGPAPATTKPATAPASPTPSPTDPSKPVTDELGTALQARGLVCVQANDDPVINDCESNPADAYTSMRWIVVSQQMAGFHLYAKAKTTDEKQRLNDLVRQLHVAGLERSDESAIIKAFGRVKKKESRLIDVHRDWGTVQIKYIDQLDAFQLDGDRSGGRPVHYAGNTFGADQNDITKRLESRDFDCKATSYDLTCSKDAASLMFYRNDASTGYNYLNADTRSRSTDEAVLDLLPLLVGSDIEPIDSMINANLESSFFLGASAGYLVQLSSGYLSIECVTW